LSEPDPALKDVWSRLKVLLEHHRYGLKDADEQVRFSAYALLARGELAGVPEAVSIVSRLTGVPKRTYLKQKLKLRKTSVPNVISNEEQGAETEPIVSSTIGARSTRPFTSNGNKKASYSVERNSRTQARTRTSDWDTSTVLSIPSAFSLDCFSNSTVKGEMKSKVTSKLDRPSNRIRTAYVNSHEGNQCNSAISYDEAKVSKCGRSDKSRTSYNTRSECPGTKAGYSSKSSRHHYPQYSKSNQVEPIMFKTRREPIIENTLWRAEKGIQTKGNRALQNVHETGVNLYKKDEHASDMIDKDPYNLKPDDGFRVCKDEFPDYVSHTSEADFADVEEDNGTRDTYQKKFPFNKITSSYHSGKEMASHYPTDDGRIVVFYVQLENTNNFHKLERSADTTLWDIKKWVADGLLEPSKLGVRIRGREIYDDKSTLGDLGLSDNDTLNLYIIKSKPRANNQPANVAKEQYSNWSVEPQGKIVADTAGNQHIHIMRGRTYENGLSLPANIIEPVHKLLREERCAEIIYKGYPCRIRVSNWSDYFQPHLTENKSVKKSEPTFQQPCKTKRYTRREAFLARNSQFRQKERRSQSTYRPSRREHEERKHHSDKEWNDVASLSKATMPELRFAVNKFTDRNSQRETDRVFKTMARWDTVNQGIGNQYYMKREDSEFSDSSSL